MRKKLIATLIAFLAIVPAFAVLNEKDLAHTLAVLRQELQMAKAEMQKSQVRDAEEPGIHFRQYESHA